MATKGHADTGGEPAIGIPYQPAAEAHGQYNYAPPPNPYAAGMPPPNAIYAGAPKGVPLQQTMFRDTPAPFHCQACGEAAVSSVRFNGPTIYMEQPGAISRLLDCLLTSYLTSHKRTGLESKPSLASVVACMMPFMLGVCFLCPSMDCLWHKDHYCPNCGEKVGEFRKSDPCLVVDATRWSEPSFAVPA
ncbi:hypothetical protein U9M48_023316 [Paspalum notatum var. saurae]|uniref:LITAF domain-containing protein n=1 Tax=Paspalum notatum var. saurae TaxID=547442 RepID=A0AAQ3TJK6_PASNO